MKKLVLGFLAASCLIAGPLPVATANGEHLITMQQADIRSFIDDVSIVTGKTFLVDPRVQGKVTISSERMLNPTEVFDVFKNVMRVHGYTVIASGRSEYRITLLQGAAADAGLARNNGASGSLSTVIIKLSHVDAAEAAKLIKPVMHNQGILSATPNGNVLVITDFPENLSKAREIVAALDIDGNVTEIVQLNNVTALDAESMLKTLSGARPSYRAVAVPGTNQLVLEGPMEEVSRLLPILKKLDSVASMPRGAVSVVPLRFADGESLIQLLNTLLPAYRREGKQEPAVAYESFSNTIVISADAESQQALESIIRRLDVRRPQVLVEAIIVEISDTMAKELGVQFALGGVNGNAVPLIGTNFSSQAASALSLTGALAGSDIGLSDTIQSTLETAAINSIVGVEGGLIGFGGNSNDTLFSMIINAIEEDEESNVLSTPFVTTLDNVPATFLVGQEIPITTGESLSSDSVNVFRTYERQEVGIKLDVLPQISEGDVIRLEIKQEVSSIAGAVSTLSSDFITNKREIATTVLANDGEIIVLGGLIQDDEQVTIDKIPVLGDLPVVGRLFQSEAKSRSRTNLMVFLRPKIIRSAEDARPITQERLNYMRSEDMSQSHRDISKIDELLPR